MSAGTEDTGPEIYVRRHIDGGWESRLLLWSESFGMGDHHCVWKGGPYRFRRTAIRRANRALYRRESQRSPMWERVL